MNPVKKSDPLVVRERLSWWVRTLVNIYLKLYGPAHTAEFYRDHRTLIEGLMHFRSRCQGRGWAIPESAQEQLLAKLVLRCQEAIQKKAIDHAYLPGYLGKALSRFVGEIADEASLRWKARPDLKNLPPEILRPILEAAFARLLQNQISRT